MIGRTVRQILAPSGASNRRNLMTDLCARKLPSRVTGVSMVVEIKLRTSPFYS
jgi:hypothetical protein